MDQSPAAGKSKSKSKSRRERIFSSSSPRPPPPPPEVIEFIVGPGFQPVDVENANATPLPTSVTTAVADQEGPPTKPPRPSLTKTNELHNVFSSGSGSTWGWSRGVKVYPDDYFERHSEVFKLAQRRRDHGAEGCDGMECKMILRFMAFLLAAFSIWNMTVWLTVILPMDPPAMVQELTPSWPLLSNPFLYAATWALPLFLSCILAGSTVHPIEITASRWYYVLSTWLLAVQVVFLVYFSICQVSLNSISVKTHMAKTMGAYLQESNKGQGWDELQARYNCCGISNNVGREEWLQSAGQIPRSCCSPAKNGTIVFTDDDDGEATSFCSSENTWTDGCFGSLMADQGYYLVHLLVCLAFGILIQILTIFAAIRYSTHFVRATGYPHFVYTCVRYLEELFCPCLVRERSAKVAPEPRTTKTAFGHHVATLGRPKTAKRQLGMELTLA